MNSGNAKTACSSENELFDKGGSLPAKDSPMLKSIGAQR